MVSHTLEGRDGQDTFAWSAANEGKDTIVDFSLGEDHFRLGSFLTGFDGSEAKLEHFVRFEPDSSGTASVLQVDADGPASGGWRDLALAQGVRDLHALPLYQVGDLLIDGRSPEVPFDSLAYIASYDDLVHAFGANTPAGKQHYLAHGYDEGRSVTFDGLQYIATYGDLIHALGPAPKAGAEHFIQHGLGEERARDGFDEVQYVANYPDLQAAFGTDYEAATRHFITNGYDEERTDKPLTAARISWCEPQHRTTVWRGRAGGGRSAEQVRAAAWHDGSPSRRWPWREDVQQAWRDGRGRRVPCPALAEDEPVRTTKVVLAAAHLDHDPDIAAASTAMSGALPALPSAA